MLTRSPTCGTLNAAAARGALCKSIHTPKYAFSTNYASTVKNLWIDADTKFVVQGMTGKQGTFHSKQCQDYGTRIVGGVNPNRAGEKHMNLPIFKDCSEAAEKTGATATLLFVPSSFAKEAIMDAISAKMKLVVAITEGIPQWDMVEIKHKLLKQDVTRVLGPNCPGLIRPGHAKVGIMPAEIHKPGNIGVVSRSGTLTYEAVNQLSSQNLGQSLVVGIGGDPISGTSFIEVVSEFLNDDNTQGLVMIGEIGGNSEELVAEYLKEFYKDVEYNKRKPIVAYIAGQTAPPGKRMGHAGAIISGTSGRADSKIEALKGAGVYVVDLPTQIGVQMKKLVESVS